jgi:cholesterol transport system auxiliary component
MTVSTETRNATSKQPSLWALLSAVLLVSVLIQCITVSGQSDEPILTYLLEIEQTGPVASNPSGPVLMVSNVRAQTGVGSIQILYLERAFELRQYRYSQWAERPDRMLEPILLNALEASGQFEAVVGVAYGTFADVRLDTSRIQLQHQIFEEPSQARVRMRVQIIDLDTQEVLGTRIFDETEPAPSENPYGGVTAMNLALGRVIDQIVTFTAEAAQNRSQ